MLNYVVFFEEKDYFRIVIYINKKGLIYKMVFQL